jgi:hypothetical protein
VGVTVYLREVCEAIGLSNCGGLMMGLFNPLYCSVQGWDLSQANFQGIFENYLDLQISDFDCCLLFFE